MNFTKAIPLSVVALLAATAIPASAKDGWTQQTEARIAEAIQAAPDSTSGLATIELSVAPDGHILSAQPVVMEGSGLRRGVARVISALGSLPPLEGATAPKLVTMHLAFSASPEDNRRQLARLHAALKHPPSRLVAMQ